MREIDLKLIRALDNDIPIFNCDIHILREFNVVYLLTSTAHIDLEVADFHVYHIEFYRISSDIQCICLQLLTVVEDVAVFAAVDVE